MCSRIKRYPGKYIDNLQIPIPWCIQQLTVGACNIGRSTAAVSCHSGFFHSAEMRWGEASNRHRQQQRDSGYFRPRFSQTIFRSVFHTKEDEVIEVCRFVSKYAFSSHVFESVSRRFYTCLGLFCFLSFASLKYFFQKLSVKPLTKPASWASVSPSSFVALSTKGFCGYGTEHHADTCQVLIAQNRSLAGAHTWVLRIPGEKANS